MTEMEDRRVSGLAARIWWAVRNPGRMARFNRWRKTPATVTKGFLAFRDAVALGFVAAIVVAGTTTVNALRREDCLHANDTRINAASIATADVTSDREIWEAIDVLVEGIPEPTRTVIFNELIARQSLIESTYAERSCSA